MIANWTKLEFGSIAKLSKNKFHPKKSKEDKKCIELEHIQKKTGHLLGFVSSRDQLSTKNIFSKGNILFGKLRPNLRKYFYCDFDGVCSSEIWVLIPQKEVHPKYLFYLVQQEKFIQTACVTSGSKMPRADWQHVSQTPFYMPFIPEQKAIASLLEKWDIAIEKTEALIAAKQKQFKWLVKILIERKQYINGWQESTLGDLFDIYVYSSKNKFISSAGKRFIVDMGSISRDGDLIVSKHTDSNTDILQIYDLVMPKDDFGSGYIIGRVAIIEYKDKYVCGDHVYRLISKSKDNTYFLRFLINSPTINRELRKKATGTSQLGLSKKDVAKQQVWLPPATEQKAIVQTLSTAQQGIVLLEQLAERYRVQKRGLMNKLLKGEWRIAA